MNLFFKINHWVLFLTFLGLVCTALSADFFFSKQAIMNSFSISTPQLGLSITPADQLFMARIARRVTWDWHLFIGIIFSISLILIAHKYERFEKLNLINISILVMLITGFILTISGILMFIRLYNPISDDFFQLLKIFHNNSKWIFMISVVVHIYAVIKNHNNKDENILSSMFKK
jgi:cytochrome b561